ncbi:MAG TPA: hypothetical protein VEF76_12585, partial [Patescibacteria group bacterium]|nr:hypothetical protein [Patescibacteria group bacterium]
MRLSAILLVLGVLLVGGLALDTWHRHTATPRIGAVCRGVTSDDAEAARLRDAAARGEAAAQYEVGRFHLFGRDAAPDVEHASIYLNYAAEKGNMDAQFELGRLYDYEAFRKDEPRARKFYRAAMLQGHKSAASSYVGLLHRSEDMDETA